MGISYNGFKGGNSKLTGITSMPPAAVEANYPAPITSPVYRFLRMDITCPDYIEVIDLHYIANGTEYPIQNMSSDTAPSPLVATADTNWAGIYNPYFAFSTNLDGGGGPTSRWHSDGSGSHWIQIDLGAGNGISPTAFTMTIMGGTAGRYPSAIIVSGSDTGSFAGEESVIYTSTEDLTTYWTYYVPKILTF